MGFLADNHEPKELSPSEYRDDRFIDIHKQGKVDFDSPKFSDYFFGKRYVVFSTEVKFLFFFSRQLPSAVLSRYPPCHLR